MHHSSILLIFLSFPNFTLSRYVDNYEQALTLTNAVYDNFEENENFEIYDLPPQNGTKPPPAVSILAGKIPDHLISKMAEYIYSLLQGTGRVIKPAQKFHPTTPSVETTTSTTSAPPTEPPIKLLPFREPLELAVIKEKPKTIINTATVLSNNIRRNPQRTLGISKQKIGKFWKKLLMRRKFGRI